MSQVSRLNALDREYLRDYDDKFDYLFEDCGGSMLGGLLLKVGREVMQQQFAENEKQKEAFAKAIETLGSAEAAVEWFTSPCAALGGDMPAMYCLHNEPQQVLTILTRIEHGVYS